MVEILLFYPEQKALRLNSNEISIVVRNYLFKTVSQPTGNPEIKAEVSIPREQPEQPSYHDLTQDKSSSPLSLGGSLKSSPLSSSCAIARPGYSFSITLTTPVHVYGSAHQKPARPPGPLAQAPPHAVRRHCAHQRTTAAAATETPRGPSPQTAGARTSPCSDTAAPAAPARGPCTLPTRWRLSADPASTPRSRIHACSASVTGLCIAATASEFHVSTLTFIACPGVSVHTAQLELVSTTRCTLRPPSRAFSAFAAPSPQSRGRRLGQAGGESEKSIVYAVWMRAAAPWVAAS